ncbi:hypothetical protein MNBD_NITROSPIRAE01-242 [hydrothermal vent metagenome]|uniref:Cytoplasmic protein clustered with trehalase n=1 Tax=hydrothermal vent metagenome TaxID=652676 RepID=A0A3B1D8H5_9ZZZZ
MTQTITIPETRRLALARAGLLKADCTGFPTRTPKSEKQSRAVAHQVIKRFGYLQLDTVSIAGARSHAIVLLSRLKGFDPQLAETLLQPGEALFEYWGHEASWIPMSLYPVFAFRRKIFLHHPWWGDLIGEHPKVAEDLRRRIRDEGPLRSIDMEGGSNRSWWDFKIAKRVANALWSSGEFAIRERRNFHRTYDLAERVIPKEFFEKKVSQDEALETLLLLALQGHGWASTGTLRQTWRLSNLQVEIKAALKCLVEKEKVLPCTLVDDAGKHRPGWIRPEDLELAIRLKRIRPRQDKGVLLSPFDPILWDRSRVKLLFGFDQILEIFKPATQRIYGYYCLPVLAGEKLIARYDLKADRKKGTLNVLSLHFEKTEQTGQASAEDVEATKTALRSYAEALTLKIVDSCSHENEV